MEPEVPPVDPTAPLAPEPVAPAPVAAAPPVPETAEARHTRELEQSFERLEHTVESRLVRALKVAIPVLVGVVVAAVAVYKLGNVLRDRAERRRVARAIRHARSRRGRRELAASIAETVAA